MSQSKVWQTARLAAACAFSAYALLFCAYQLYSAAAHGTVYSYAGSRDWITFQSNPIAFVFSLLLCGLVITIVVAGIVVWAFDIRPFERWRSRQHVDVAIRLPREER